MYIGCNVYGTCGVTLWFTVTSQTPAVLVQTRFDPTQPANRVWWTRFASVIEIVQLVFVAFLAHLFSDTELALPVEYRLQCHGAHPVGQQDN